MNGLQRAVDDVYDFLAVYVDNNKIEGIDSAYEQKCELLSNHDCFFLFTCLEPTDVDLFLLFYVKYMNSCYKDAPENLVAEKFSVLRENIIEAGRLIEQPAISFLCENDSKENFTKGYLFEWQE